MPASAAQSYTADGDSQIKRSIATLSLAASQSDRAVKFSPYSFLRRVVAKLSNSHGLPCVFTTLIFLVTVPVAHTP